MGRSSPEEASMPAKRRVRQRIVLLTAVAALALAGAGPR
jgi:hypothetical protein